MTMAWAQTIVIGGPTLTARERQVVALLAGGRTRKEVAFELGIAHSTVRVLNARAVKKLERSDELTIAESPAPAVRAEPG
jgi:DNA-binding NarL/FixJ family response regulator